MFTQIAGIVLLAVMFIIATVLPINMGALALVAAFIVGLLSHVPARDIFVGFPGDLFVTLVGITYLFAIAQNNGTVDWLVHKAVWLVRGRVAVMPWVMFFVAAVLTGVMESIGNRSQT
jgi:di/tricarboxylate transporter